VEPGCLSWLLATIDPLTPKVVNELWRLMDPEVDPEVDIRPRQVLAG
jgi:hypothetical protein